MGQKISTGIRGVDDITRGGLPRGRVTAVLGGAGCGKTIFAMQTLAAGAADREPGLFITFEQSPEQVAKDISRFVWASAAKRRGGVEILDAQLSDAVLHGGEFDVLGLLAVVGAKAKRGGCKRIVFDGIDVLLDHLADPTLIRREIFRLRAWLYESGLTGLITVKTDSRNAQLSAEYEVVEFLADCVVSLQHRVVGGAALRTMRAAKYRGEAHSANEFPFTITSAGLEVAAGTSAQLDHAVWQERVSSGVEGLDAMLRGGYHRGSSVLLSGSPGTSKTTLAAAFANAACRRKESTVFVSFDEAPAQIIRNVASIGIDFARHVEAGLLHICSLRARTDNPEAHVARIRALVELHGAKNLVVDPLSALAHASDDSISDRAAAQVLDVAKSRGITTVSTSLLANATPLSEQTPISISTIADTWIHVSYVSHAGERNRALTIIKSRGTAHSNQVRELVLRDSGITLADPYMAGGHVLMGTLRWERENDDRRAKLAAASDAEAAQRRAELEVAQARLRSEAAVVDQAMREAELERVLTKRASAAESDRLETRELSERRGGASTPLEGPKKGRARSRR